METRENRLTELKRITYKRLITKRMREILTSQGKRAGGAFKMIKAIFSSLSKNRKIIGKLIISLIAIFAFYKCVINPPIYYMDVYKNKVYDKKEAYGQVPTVDINKLLSELLGLSILSSLTYFLLVRNKDKG